MSDAGRRRLGCVFNEVPELYDRMRPTYPDELFADLASIAGIDDGSSVLEVGCGTGQATRSLAALGCSVTAVDPGPAMAAIARQRLAHVPAVHIENATFEQWDDHGMSFDALVAAASWHWVEPALGPLRGSGRGWSRRGRPQAGRLRAATCLPDRERLALDLA